MSARAGGGTYLRRYVDKYSSEIYIKLLTSVGPLQVWLVHGRVIRDKVFLDFTEGGNSNAYAWLPPYQIVIDADATEQEQQFTQLHELTEYNAMATGLGYERAHTYHANRMEQRARDNPALWPQLWEQQKQIFLKRLREGLRTDLDSQPGSPAAKRSRR